MLKNSFSSESISKDLFLQGLNSSLVYHGQGGQLCPEQFLVKFVFLFATADHEFFDAIHVHGNSGRREKIFENKAEKNNPD